MTIHLTDTQWAEVRQEKETPVRITDPEETATFVLLSVEVYERFRSLFETDPITDEERRFQLQQFGKRAGWDDPTMDVYDDRDPRRNERLSR
ncbi:MAG TPA: hypothetical protein VG125_26810 [Pirellulales bacterium]|jgi:hypothetical protein|nr:hypothetical protein [Pirellulales bacterium]